MDLTALAAAAETAVLPVTLIGTVISGWVGNRSDHYIRKAYQAVYDRYRSYDEPINHDIQRAVRGAYLKATLIVCQRLIAGKTTVIERYLLYPTLDIKEVVTYLKAQIHQLPTTSFNTPASQLTTQYDLLIQPRGETASQRGEALQQQLRTSMLDELAAAGLRVEADLKATLLTGLTDGDKHVDWYGLLCAFFTEELKTNSRLSSIINADLLLHLKKQVPDVAWPDTLLEEQTELIGKAMQPLAAQYKEILKELDVMLGLLLELKTDVAQVLRAVEAGNDTNRDLLLRLLDEIAKLHLQPPTPANYINTFAHYDFARLIGREDEVTAIDKHLTKHRMLLLRGMGGAGKTTLARAYLDRAHSRNTHAHIAFVAIAGTIADSMLNQLGNSTDVAFTADPQQTTDERFDSLIDVLRHIPNLLLVLDNVENADAASDLRQRKAALESLDATVLITGRVRMSEFVQADQFMELGSLSPDEAFALFERYLERKVKPTEEEIVKTMLNKAFYHAKLIEVIATQCRRNPSLTLSNAHDLVAKRSYDHDDINYEDWMDEQAKTIHRILLDLFNTDPLADDLKQLLRYFAVLPTIDIPFEHLATLFGAATSADRKTLTINLNRLAQTAWLDQPDTNYFSMHSLVQWVVRQRLEPTAQNCEPLLNGMANAFYSEPTENPLDKQVYLPYTAEWTAIFMDSTQSLANSYNSIAITYGALGDYAKALDYGLRALAIRKAVLHSNHPDLAISYNNVASTYGALGDHTQRLDYNLRALAIREVVFPSNHLDLANSYNNIAATYTELGDNAKGLEYILKAVEIREAVLSPNHPDLARSYNNIAAAYTALGNNAKGLEYILKAGAIREAVLPPNHPDLAQSYSNIAAVYGNLGDHTQRLDYNLRALAIREAVLPPNHPDLAISYNNIASTYGALGDHARRLKYNIKALAIREAVLSLNHPDLAISYNNIALTYYYIGELTKAVVYMQQAVAIRERMLPPSHPDISSSQQSLAVIQRAIQERDGNAG